MEKKKAPPLKGNWLGLLFVIVPAVGIVMMLRLKPTGPLNANGFVLNAFVFGLISFSIVWILSYGKSGFQAKAIPVAAFFLILWVFSIIGLATIVNRRYDASSGRQYLVQVLDRQRESGTGSGHGGRTSGGCYAIVTSWRTPGATERLRVSYALYSEIEPRKTRLNLAIRDGFLGYEYVEKMERVTEAAEAPEGPVPDRPF